jgi:hypothetical protein
MRIRAHIGKVRDARLTNDERLHHIHKALEVGLGKLNIDRSTPEGRQHLATLANIMAKQPEKVGGGRRWYSVKAHAVGSTISAGATFGRRPSPKGDVLFTRTKEGGTHSYHDWRGDLSRELRKRGVSTIPDWIGGRGGKGDVFSKILQRVRARNEE